MTLLIRTLLFKSKKEDAINPEPVEFDRKKATEDLRELIRCKTISYSDNSLEDEREFIKLEEYTKKAFPLVYKNTEFTKVGTRGMLFKWTGLSSESPAVLMAHYDVVPVEESGWKLPPFSGEIIDGELWGRGTLDTKCTFNAVLQAAEKHIKDGFTPKNDIYMAFAGDEETAGSHASAIVNILKEKGVVPKIVVDEGGAVVDNVFPGVKKRSALIGIAEKGFADIKYTVKGSGGHSSTPPRQTPISILSKACIKVNNTPFKMRLTKPALEMFDTLGRESKSFPIKLIFANLWLFKGLLGKMASMLGGEMNALVRTSTVFTQMKGSDAMNVIPPEASMLSNHRIIHGETVQSTLEFLKKTVNDKRVELEVVYGNEPSRISETTGTEGYEILRNTIREVWNDVIVSPYLMLAASDSRHYGLISDRVYRFSPLNLTKDLRKLIHSNDERIKISEIEKSVEFYIRLISKL